MQSLNDTSIRSSFVNATRKEVSDLSLPNEFADVKWDELDYLGWRDRKFTRRAYIVVPVGDGTVGIILKQADATPRARAQCTWCQDVRLPNDVVFYGARRAGPAGRNGDTVGTLVCADFQCSRNVRMPAPMAYLGFDVDAAREQRILALRSNAAGFAAAVVRKS
jgi:hypothetical protein